MSIGPVRLIDHLARHIEDPDGLAHVEHEGLAVAADRGGLDDQLHGFVTVMK